MQVNSSSTKATTYSAHSLWWDYIKEHWASYSFGGFSVGMTGLSLVFIPYCLGQALDLLKGEKISHYFNRGTPGESYEFIFFILVIAHLLLFFSRIGWRMFLANQTYHAGHKLRTLIWERVRFFPKDKLDREYTPGVLMNASTSDVNTARFIYGFTLVAAFDVFFLGIFTLVTMISINVEMTLWTIIIYPIFPFFIRKLSHLEGERFHQAQEFLSQFNDMCSQAISTIRLQRLTQTGKFWERRLNKAADEYREKRLTAVFTSLSFIPLMGTGTILSYIILFALGLHKVIQGTMTVGEFVTMQSYVSLIQDPLMELGFLISEWQRSKTSLNRLSEIYNEKEGHGLSGGGQPLDDRGLHDQSRDLHKKVLSVQNISFSYPANEGIGKEIGEGIGERPIFSNLSFELSQGERLGVIGNIGQGKTTLVNLLAGLERPQQGNILLLEKELTSYNHQNLRKFIGLVPQKTFLFADTIKNNISMDKNLSDVEVWDYLEVAGLRSDVEKFPDGIFTQLGEWGINLSGGQKQRLTLARSLAARPRLLLLDDCVSAVDTLTEEKILQALNKELKGTTLVWVAHRNSTLKYCDKILELSSLGAKLTTKERDKV